MVAMVVHETTTIGDAIAIVDDAYSSCYLYAAFTYSGKVGLVFTKSGTLATYIQFSIVLFLKNEKGTSAPRPTWELSTCCCAYVTWGSSGFRSHFVCLHFIETIGRNQAASFRLSLWMLHLMH